MVFTIIIKGLDETIAEAVAVAFYESYTTWKMDHPNASTRQQVNLPTKKDSSAYLDSPVGAELECSSGRHGNT